MWMRVSYAIAVVATLLCLAQRGHRSKVVAAVNSKSSSLQTLSLPVEADSLVVSKDDRLLHLYSDGAVVKSYTIVLGFSPRGAKRYLGDGRTPEGRYTINGRNPQSSYHLSLRISYPDPTDRMRARKAGLRPGGDICIHGWPDSVKQKKTSPPAGDWTLGCIAVTNEEIEELWRAVPLGMPVIIYP